MESKIPLPTDNIYKFYALFSLLLFVFSIGGVIYLSNSTNAVVFENWVEVETLRAEKELSPGRKARKEALEKQIEIAVDNKKTGIQALGGLSAFAICLMVFGFSVWQKKIQPVSDETASTQLDIAKLQRLKLREELKALGYDVDRA